MLSINFSHTSFAQWFRVSYATLHFSGMSQHNDNIKDKLLQASPFYTSTSLVLSAPSMSFQSSTIASFRNLFLCSRPDTLHSSQDLHSVVTSSVLVNECKGDTSHVPKSYHQRLLHQYRETLRGFAHSSFSTLKNFFWSSPTSHALGTIQKKYFSSYCCIVKKYLCTSYKRLATS